MPRPIDAVLAIRHDDGARVELDGVRVLDSPGMRSFEFPPERAPLHLEPRWSRLVVRIENALGGWGFAVELRQRDREPIPGIEFSATGPR